MKRISENAATCMVRFACAALLASPVTLSFAQQQAQPVPPPHGLASGNHGATSSGGAGDALITAKAKTALLATKDVHGSHIKVTTEQGVVTLTGTVSSAEEKARAEHAVQGLDGVTRVDDRLNVAGAAQ